MNKIQYIKKVLHNLIGNFHFLGKYHLEPDFFQQYQSRDQIRKDLLEFYFDINKNEAQQYEEELQYLRTKDSIEMFPYSQNKHLEEKIISGYDTKKHLPYVIHNNKYLFFPAHWTKEYAEKIYRYFIERENITNGKYTPKTPHQYQSDTFKIETGDILLDIGCAEGLVALDSIEKTKKTILYESDPIWEAPLKATFEPFQDKVEIINKWVSDNDSETTTTLISSTLGLENETFFVKMDIEGAEEFVIKGNADFFKNRKVKAACCTYHKYEHFENLNTLFKNWNYATSSSDGYILCFMDKVFRPPYFRKGLIRATNIK